MLVAGWIRNLIGLIVFSVLAYFIPPLLPSPFSTIAYVILGLIALIFAIFLIIDLVRLLFGGGVARGPRNPNGPMV